MGNIIDRQLFLLKRDEEFFNKNKEDFINFFIKEISNQNSALFDEGELKEFAKKVYYFLFMKQKSNKTLLKNYLFSFKKEGVDIGSLFLNILIFMQERYIPYLKDEKKDLAQSLEGFIYLFKKSIKALQSLSLVVKDDEKENKIENSYKNGSISEIFEKAKEAGKRVKLLNFYRGIPIENEADILECDENMVVLRTSALQEMAMKLSNRVFIEKEDIFPQTVKAEIEVVNFMNNSVVIKNPRYYFESNFKNKLENLKVEPKFPQSVKIGKNLRIFKGWIFNISLKNISLMSEEDICQKFENLNIELCLDKDDYKCVNLQMRVEDKYLRNGYYNYIGTLILDKEGEKKIYEFIQRRKDEAVLELREELEYYMV